MSTVNFEGNVLTQLIIDIYKLNDIVDIIKNYRDKDNKFQQITCIKELLAQCEKINVHVDIYNKYSDFTIEKGDN